ncbi:MAG: helix-turn-helix transcriptional regulator [Clostridia bacterium]|nr:helix-turn-helix transcriptional regulator [Clostridia bacterium]
MSFGEKIRKLRHDTGLTQERLAELLSISPQAVSRWENDVAMPDVSLLPPLANLFQVTTDYLLGMDTYQKDLRKAEFDAAFHEYWMHDDKEANYQIACRAVAEYPGNMEYVEWLASAEYYVAIPTQDNAEYTRLLESSVKHYNLVLENCSDRKLYNKALHGIVLALHMLGRKEEALEYAGKQEDEEKRNELLLWCLRGEEKIKLGQEIAESHLNRFLFYLGFAEKSIGVYAAVENILHILFPDGNYQYYHNTLQYNAQNRAMLLCREEKYDEAVDVLKEARHHAEEMVKYGKQTNFAFTSPFFNRIAKEKPASDSAATDLDDFIRGLNNRCYDPLREREDFRALLIV